VQGVADDEAGVIVHERDEIDPAVLALEHESEQVGLPQLVGPGPLEGADLVGVRRGGLFLQDIAGLTQNGGDRVG
jgi:hypothetical protein